MTMFVPPIPTTDMAKRLAALMPSGDTDWAQRGQSAARSILLVQANRLEELAATDDLALYRQAKADDATYVSLRQYSCDNLPLMMAESKNGGHGEAMLSYLHGNVCQRREMLLGTALLLKRLAEQPMNTATLEAADACIKMLPAAARI